MRVMVVGGSCAVAEFTMKKAAKARMHRRRQGLAIEEPARCVSTSMWSES
jgi:hypothetical protein